MHIKDVECCYYNLLWPRHMLPFNAVGRPTSGAQLLASGATRDRDYLASLGDRPVASALRVPAMGDQKAASVVQTWHTHTLQSGGNLLDPTWMTYGHPPPSGDRWEGVYIDDAAAVGIYEYIGDKAWTASQAAAQRMDLTYEHNNIPKKVSKAVRGAADALIWGGELNSTDRMDVGGELDPFLESLLRVLQHVLVQLDE